MRTRRRIWVALAVMVGVLLAPAVGWGAYAAVTWLTFGATHRAESGADPRVTRYMPRYDVAEVHRVRVAAPAAVTYEAARRLDLQRAPVVRAIFRGREMMLGAAPTSRPPDETFFEELGALGWGVLDTVPGRQTVFGAVTRPWEANVVFRALPRDAFAAWDSAGYVKIVVTIAVDSLGPSASEVRTETRALATDAAARGKFRRYWAVFSPGILLIRSQALRLVQGEAERLAAGL